ncbi:MAG: T9SS type A sorting domain-containing protein [Cyclobacteriaceae bacterium]
MKKTFTKQLLGLFLILMYAGVSAQDAEGDGKIVLEITKEVNGEKKTFKGEYENEAQMRADPNYKEFVGEDGDFNFGFHGVDHNNIAIDIQKLMDQNGFNFSFDTDSGPKAIFGFDSAMVFDFSKDMEQMAEEMQRMGANVQAFRLDGDTGMAWVFGDSSNNAVQNHVRVFGDMDESGDAMVMKKLKIIEIDGDEFGKKGKVKDSESLELESLDYYPNPSTGSFKLRFKVPQQGELSVKVYDLDGKEVFSRYFNQFGGTYSESLDLTDQSAGVYLLEVQLDKKRLTRKIVIE